MKTKKRMTFLMLCILFLLIITSCSEDSTGPNDTTAPEPGEMIFVQGGQFSMGDQFNEGHSDETPTHDVTVNSFYIGQYEVTQAEYEAVIGETTSNSGYGVGDNYPVYYVSWYDAVEYCNALSVQEGLTPCYNTSTWECDFSANGYRLPTEAEWEYAARGGAEGFNDNHRYSGCHDSEDLTNYAWHRGNNDPNGTKEVGTKLPNQLGIYDMSGNVWEWCNDWYSSNYYNSSPSDNPTGPNSGSYRVKRGGSWNHDAKYCRVAYRYYYDPDVSSSRIGLRILKTSE